MTEKQIGKRLRKLRKKRRLRQQDLALAIEGIDAVVVSRWENGEGLRRFIRHAPELMVLLGPDVWRLVYQAADTIHRRDDWEWVGPIAKALTDLLREKTLRVRARARAERWMLPDFPTLEEVAERLGRKEPLSLMDQLHLSDAIWCTDITRGWQLTEQQRRAATRAHRRTTRPPDL